MSDIRHPEKINRVSNPIPKKPPWIRVKAPTSKFFKSTNKIIKDKKPVIFVSGHFANYELMSMEITKLGIELAAIYRPLNNPYLNNTMERIRKRDICKKQIKKGRPGTREIVKLLNKGTSIALMIDQRVREGEKVKFFDHLATTTTIPAQLIKRYNCDLVPIYIERKSNENFFLEVMDPLIFENNQTIDNITLKLNQTLEQMITRTPNQWIWSHNRWK